MNLEKLTQSNLLETLKLDKAPKEEQEEAMSDASEIIFRSAMGRIKDGLSEDEREEFERVFGEEAAKEEQDAFLKEHVPNLEEMLAQEAMRYKYLMGIIASQE